MTATTSNGRLLRTLLPALLACLLAGAAAAPGAGGAERRACGKAGYAYAGVARLDAVGGVRATLTALVRPRVASGHVAAWIGIGSRDAGPGGAAQWLQVGLVSVPGMPGVLYYEIARTGRPPRLVPILDAVAPGARHRVAVRETPESPGRWRVWVDGRPASPAFPLASTPRARRPTVTAETWDGGRPACNRFSFRFDEVEVAGAGGGWRPFAPHRRFQDPGYRLVPRSPSSFRASSDA